MDVLVEIVKGVGVAVVALGLAAAAYYATRPTLLHNATQADPHHSRRRRRDYVILYHYTDVNGRRGIMTSGVIWPSNGTTDAVYGNGVYLTSKNPSVHSMGQIAQNNYDGRPAYWMSKLDDGVTRYGLELRIPADEVNQMPDNRDVWLYTDGNLDFHRFHTGKVFEGTPDGQYIPWYLQSFTSSSIDTMNGRVASSTRVLL